MTKSSVVLNRYSGTYDKGDKFSVKIDGQLKCKNMTEEGGRAFAAKIGGEKGYVDKTKERSIVVGKSIKDTPIAISEPKSPEETKKARFGNVPLAHKKDK